MGYSSPGKRKLSVRLEWIILWYLTLSRTRLTKLQFKFSLKGNLSTLMGM